MADLNSRQIAFFGKVRTEAKKLKEIYGALFNIKQSFAEEFATGQSNDLSDSELVDEIKDTFGIEYASLVSFVNQACGHYQNYYVGNAVDTREYGRDIRGVAGIYIE